MTLGSHTQVGVKGARIVADHSDRGAWKHTTATPMRPIKLGDIKANPIGHGGSVRLGNSIPAKLGHARQYYSRKVAGNSVTYEIDLTIAVTGNGD